MTVRSLPCLAVLAALAPSLASQSSWRIDGASAPVRIVGPTTAVVIGAQTEPLVLPAGRYAVHFGADAAGKPRSLQFPVSAADAVAVAVEPAATREAREIALDAAGWGDATDVSRGDGLVVRSIGDAEERDYRVEGVFATTSAADGCVGLIARHSAPRCYYRLTWRLARGEVLLERCQDDLVLQLARADLPAGEEREHVLALQVEGFRVAAFVDDALVAQALDGAFSTGAYGTCSTPTSVQCKRFTVGAPAVPRTSAALAGGRGAARFHAATTAIPGSFGVLEVSLHRVHPPVPQTGAAVEPWLVREGALPRVVLADWRGSLGTGSTGEISPTGTFDALLSWPALAGVVGQDVLVRAILVGADGDATLGATPAVTFRL